jgi:hypothetical protein
MRGNRRGPLLGLSPLPGPPVTSDDPACGPGEAAPPAVTQADEPVPDLAPPAGAPVASTPAGRVAAQRTGRDVWAWDHPLGYQDSIQSAGTFAAPILAGASFTLAALLIQASATVTRWPDAALFCLAGAGLCLIYAVQAIVWARRYTVTPDELLQWLPDDWEDGRPTPWLLNLQDSHFRQARKWARRSRAGYHAGIILLLAGVAVILVPSGHIALTRWYVIGLGCAGVLAEAAWIAVATFSARKH